MEDEDPIEPVVLPLGVLLPRLRDVDEVPVLVDVPALAPGMLVAAPMPIPAVPVVPLLNPTNQPSRQLRRPKLPPSHRPHRRHRPAPELQRTARPPKSSRK
jgi:hypothetical protein